MDLVLLSMSMVGMAFCTRKGYGFMRLRPTLLLEPSDSEPLRFFGHNLPFFRLSPLGIVLRGIFIFQSHFISDTMAAFDMIGQIALFAGAYTPRHWKRCDGSILNIVEYRALFDIIGDTYGGNGTTTFALPNLGGRYMVCAQGARPNLRPEAWSEILPPGEDSPESGSFGTGFTAGGGMGAIPAGTSSTTVLTGDWNTRTLFGVPSKYEENVGDGFNCFGIESYNETDNDYWFIGNTDDDPGSLTFFRNKVGSFLGSFGISSSGVFLTSDLNARFEGGFGGFNMTAAGHTFIDKNASELGIEYAADYSATIAANPRSIPDVGGVELISGRIYRATATLNFGSTAAGQSSDLTVAVIGASVGDPVSVGLPAAPDANSCFTAWVSAVDTVTVRFNNYSAGAIDPASGSYKVIVSKY